MNETIRVLQLEESESDAREIVSTLERAGYKVLSTRVADRAGMRAALQNEIWDVIIADFCLSRFDASAALELLRASGRDIPFIVVSGAAGEELAVAVMKSGAQDYLMKKNLARLAPAVEREIREARARSERRQAEIELRHRESRLMVQQEIMARQRKALEEKEALLREIHHRVKNNLQVVYSLLGLQSRSSSNAETTRQLDAIRDRIHSMALLHDALYQSDNLAQIDLAGYIEQLADHLYQSCGVRRDRVQLRASLAHVSLDLDVALPCGLIINEVVSNSLQHGFPDEREGEVTIVLEESPGGTVSLRLADNGIGMGDDFDRTVSRSLGVRLIKALARQLDATLEIRGNRGTEFRLTFPREPHTIPCDSAGCCATTDPRS